MAAPASPPDKKAVTSKPPLVDRLVPWLRPSLTRRNLKTFVRCMLVFLASLVLLLDQRALNTMGQAAFFAALLNLMLPPSMPLTLFFFAALTLLIGMLVGWMWGVVGMAAGNAARSQALLASQYQAAQAALANDPTATLTTAVFQGAFLDTRTSATFGALFFVGTFAMGALRAHAPKLTLLSIFASIVMDVHFSYGPLFPQATQYMLANTFLIPTSAYVAIALAGTALIFPQSISHVWVSGFSRGILSPCLALLANQHDHLSLPLPLSEAAWAPLVEKGKKTRSALVEAGQGLQGVVGLIDLELSVGRIGPGDVKAVDALLKDLVYRTLAMGNFSNLVLGLLQGDAELNNVPSSSSPSGASTSRYGALRRDIKDAEEASGHGLTTLLPILASSSQPLRAGLTDSLKGVQAFFDDVNHSRWSFVPLLGGRRRSDVPDVEGLRANLEQRLTTFKEVERKALVEGPFVAYFQEIERGGKARDGLGVEHGKGGMHASSRSLFTCFVFTTTLEACTESLLNLLTLTAALQRKRTRNRLWFPSGLGKAWRKAFDSDGGSSTVIGGLGQVQEKAEEVKRAEREADEEIKAEEDGDEQPVGSHHSLARNPDASPPRTGLQKVGVKLGAVVRWLKSPKGLFALRYAIVSLCLWVVAVHPSTAHFNYVNRGLWALIMAQTSLGIFAGEQIAAFIARLVGTLLGLVVGMVAWYVGSGRGNGNPYGVAASTLFFTAPFLWARVVLPQAKMVIPLMTGVTIVFVVGYSWLDTHLAVTVNSGVGAGLAWKRALLVIIGFAAGFIVMCFPKLTTSRTLVRESCSQITDEIAGLFVSELEALLQEESVDRASSSSSSSPAAAADEKPTTTGRSAAAAARKARNLKRIAKRVIALVDQMQSLLPSLTTARFEPQLQGPWPREHYVDLLDTQRRIIIAIALLSSTLAKLEPRWCATLVHHSPFLNPDLITDVLSTLAITSQCLLSKRPLPPSVHSLRDRLVYHERTLRLGKVFSAQQHPADPGSPGSSSPSAGLEEAADDSESTVRPPPTADPSTVDGASLGIDFTPAVAVDGQFALYATAIVSLSSLLTAFDRLTAITRKLVGESARLTLLREWEGRGLALEEEGRRRHRTNAHSARSKLD